MPSADFDRIKRLPPYIFGVINEKKYALRRQNIDIIDLAMGNPDLPTPKFIVNKLVEAAGKGKNHRYSISKGIFKLREALASWYLRRFDVTLDPEKEIVTTIGSKEGLAHLMYATMDRGDTVLVPNPTYPIHTYAAVIAGAQVHHVPMPENEVDFMNNIKKSFETTWPKPKMILTCFPSNPTAYVASLDFFTELVAFAKSKDVWLINDQAYAELTFEGNPVSILQVPGAKDIAVEFYTLSKTYNMAGWRVGFGAGNPVLVGALTKIKSYLDYGMFQPIQIAATVALNEGDAYIPAIRENYRKRRDVLVDGMLKMGWEVTRPTASMFVWAKIPDFAPTQSSVEFSSLALEHAHVAFSPGLGFGSNGEGYVRIALVENELRIKQALRGLKTWLKPPGSQIK
ncbi:MAG: aminotransferase class I/II-fold pyridoxal phosphate-dependent enzyme [Bacteroidetes bacterium]|nr:aminotransferase class I/II-fold pyridoxal phosphate-dependent enzyme [Bacteroidota bacterium]